MAAFCWKIAASRLVVAILIAIFSPFVSTATAGEPQTVSIATFNVDATPPLGSPLCFGAVPPAKEIVDPLSARGIVLLSADKPLVLCAVDWVGIGNAAHDAFREALAEAAGTTVDRVSVHVLHQHDAPGVDFTAEEIAAEFGLAGQLFDVAHTRDVIARLAEAVRTSVKSPQAVTHVGFGSAIVEKVASNRRILGEDGKVKIIRFSSSKEADAIAAPEGVIDPKVRLISFWNGEQPLVSMTFYATHPQSYYGQGGVSADFVGLARQIREEALPGPAHIHFNGASGNVAAGKYNNGTPELRPILAKRLAEGMKKAWDETKKIPITATDVAWDVEPVALPLRDMYQDDQNLLAQIKSEGSPMRYRVAAAYRLAFARRIKSGHKIEIGCLHLGDARVVFMPGELFVEYQLAAQDMRPNGFVAMAAYGDYGPEYIGTKISYTQGGYETSGVSHTAPEVEDVLTAALKTLLQPAEAAKR